MKKFKVVIPLVFFLMGCPGGNPISKSRTTFIDGEHLCFSVDKKDTLNYYTVDSTASGSIQSIASSGHKELHLSYPQSCINIKWKYGYSYVIHYGLNGKKYVHEFFIDNNGQLTNLGGL
jgi:predicted metal-dependent phosphotriesterase family hydrolase